MVSIGLLGIADASLAHSKRGKAVSVEESRLFYAALRAKDVPAELFELPTGEHGLGVGKGPDWAAWQAKCSEWLKQQKFLDNP